MRSSAGVFLDDEPVEVTVPQVQAGVDMGRDHHHCVVLDAQGERLRSRRMRAGPTSPCQHEHACFSDLRRPDGIAGRRCGTLRRVIVMQPVLETRVPDGFDLWPVAEVGPADFLPLSGGLSPAEVGTAVMRIVGCNDIDPEDDRPPRPADPLGSFLHGLLTFDTLFAAGGLRVTDDSTGTTFLPGCCDGLEDWRTWHQLVDKDGVLWFGHDPVSPVAKRFGNIVQLTVDAEQGDSPVIELSVTELRRLLIGAERDLADFLMLATHWTHQHLPTGHRAPVTAALARVLDLPGPAVLPER